MQEQLLAHLRKISEEEQRILDGVAKVDKDIYTSGKDFTVDSKRCSGGKADRCAHAHPVCAFSIASPQFYRGAVCL